jgi:hypothetical protein
MTATVVMVTSHHDLFTTAVTGVQVQVISELRVMVNRPELTFTTTANAVVAFSCEGTQTNSVYEYFIATDTGYLKIRITDQSSSAFKMAFDV